MNCSGRRGKRHPGGRAGETRRGHDRKRSWGGASTHARGEEDSNSPDNGGLTESASRKRSCISPDYESERNSLIKILHCWGLHCPRGAPPRLENSVEYTTKCQKNVGGEGGSDEKLKSSDLAKSTSSLEISDNPKERPTGNYKTARLPDDGQRLCQLFLAIRSAQERGKGKRRTANPSSA